MKGTLTPSRLRRSSPLPLAGEGGTRRASGGRVRALPFRSVAKGAGAVLLGLVALDLIATVATLAIGAAWLRR
jgi:hypothetical protein